MLKIGITGGIGSGKTVVSEIMKLMGIPVYSADVESKKITETSSVIKEKLIGLFGPDIYKDNRLNKPLLASYIFTDKGFLEKVNAIIHPEVGKNFRQWLEVHETYPVVGHEAAILFESGVDKLLDKVIMVYTPLELRIQRAMERDNLSREKITERISNQLPDDKKSELSDYIINNDGSVSLIKQVYDIFNGLGYRF